METDLVKLLEDAKTQGKTEAEAQYKSQLDAIKSEQDRLAEIEKIKADAKEEARREIEAETKTNRKSTYQYSGHKVAPVGDDNDGTDAFMHYIKTGDDIPVKSALVEGTAGLGGVTVPTALSNRITDKVREDSVMRKLGPTVIPSNLWKMDFPRTATGTVAATATSETSSYTENQPVLDKVTIQTYKMTSYIKLSEELLSDNTANVDDYVTRQLSFAISDRENNWFFSGNGSSAPYGVLARSELGVTAASTGTVTAAELNTLIYSLDEKYASRGILVMRRATLGTLRGLQGNPFLFMQTPAGSGESLMANPVYQCSALGALTTGQKVIVYGDFSVYHIIDNGQIVITRNPYENMSTGLVGIYASKRVGGDAVQPEAFKHLILA